MRTKRDKLNRKRRFHFIFTACLVFSISIGCSLKGGKNDSWQPVERKKRPLVHIVQYPKETLSIIAKWYTGDTKNWELLADANPNINPDHLCVGNEIFIPDQLMKTKDPMPEGFVLRFSQKPKKKMRPTKSRNATPPLPKKGHEEKFEIFGPK